jgi:hypothetical protein
VPSDYVKLRTSERPHSVRTDGQVSQQRRAGSDPERDDGEQAHNCLKRWLIVRCDDQPPWWPRPRLVSGGGNDDGEQDDNVLLAVASLDAWAD